MESKTYHTVPGRGLITRSAIQERILFLKEKGFELPNLFTMLLNHHDVKNNIESLIGSVEVPVGLVGPLTYCTPNGCEEVFAPAATLEGALLASMNRGAKVISLSGGFRSEFIQQRMIRVPLFFLTSKSKALKFAQWLDEHFEAIKQVAESYSSYARLTELDIVVRNTTVHAGFIYTTGDASGQNMTTTCTWHSMMWIREQFEQQEPESILNAIIEGNGSSDKKVSRLLLHEGRGCRVLATCELEEAVIRRYLRTSSDAIIACFEPSKQRTNELGMPAFNINAANAIAAIFLATGQDMASVHESSLAELSLTKTEKGLSLQLLLPSLVIGTVGGGTQLPDRLEALQLMDCAGPGKIERFASLIAGFTLALEISTYAAIVSGEFAKAHEKLGRNKPGGGFSRKNITPEFIQQLFNYSINQQQISTVELTEMETEKGILTLLSGKASRKSPGFLKCLIIDENKQQYHTLIKLKSTDIEIIKGLQLIASSVDFRLAQLLVKYREKLEYHQCHYKEIAVYNWLRDQAISHVPVLYETYFDPETNAVLLCMEDLTIHPIQLDTENKPEIWNNQQVIDLIRILADFHLKARNCTENGLILPEFAPKEAREFYLHLAQLVDQDFQDALHFSVLEVATAFLSAEMPDTVWKTLVHHDFNPRNIALKFTGKNWEPVLYDWELAVYHFPQRDMMEFLSFIADAKTDEELNIFLHIYEKEANFQQRISHQDWLIACLRMLQEFIVTRCAFYTAASQVIENKFSIRVMNNAYRIMKLIEQKTIRDEKI